MATIFVGDIGTEIELDCGQDVSLAAVRKIFALKPDQTVAEWVAVQSGSNSILYVTVAGDIDQVGRHYLQSYLEISGWKGRGEVVILDVSPRVGG